jgi:hypothetical protein
MRGPSHGIRKGIAPRRAPFPISSLGRCLRSSYYDHFDPPVHEARVLKLFRGGTDTGQRVVDYVFRSGRLWGVYHCRACKHYSELPAVITCCQECGSKDLVFPEIGIRDLSIGKSLSGKMDLLFLNKGMVHVTEVKAVSSNYNVKGLQKGGKVSRALGRDNVVKKMRGYLQQGNMYLGLLRRYRRLQEKGKEPQIVFYEDFAGTIMSGVDITAQMNMDSFALLFEDKNTLANVVHEFDYDHEMYLADRARVKSFFDYVAQRKLPPREKLNCHFCDHRERCNTNKGV